ncbi:hypothetical protein BD410DRAFT_732279, partial [Rickenella mellea]
NVFGLKRRYTNGFPITDPEVFQDISAVVVEDKLPSHATENIFWPYPNYSMFALAEYHGLDETNKTKNDLRNLTSIITDPAFQPEDLKKESWESIEKKFESLEEDVPYDKQAGWKEWSVFVEIPISRNGLEGETKRLEVKSLHYRSLVETLRNALENPESSKDFVYEPYEYIWSPHGQQDQRVYGEMYSSQAFLDEHAKVQALPPEPGCDLPRAVAGLMFWSDSTHLSSFGTAKIWPLYMMLANQSKYARTRSGTCHHVAFFPSASGYFIREFTGRTATSGMMTHCRRETIHEAWRILLDDDFLRAYEHGMVVKCSDGITRRIYPRIFTYSADYLEKVLIATIRDKGQCPCPRCLIKKSDIPKLGTPGDVKRRQTLARRDDESRRQKVQEARDIIARGYVVDSQRLNPLLQEQSLVPTVNAFSQRLSQFGFDFHQMLVVDLLHEFELGVWKSLFTHIVRLLHAVTSRQDAVDELDRRFRSIPTFGRDVIRNFDNNVSGMKKLAARNFEDILQCVIPAVDGLLPDPHNGAVMKLLFTLAHWHGLAKLRMHTDSSLDLMDILTAEMSTSLQKFKQDTCQAFETFELPKEAEARARRTARKAATDVDTCTKKRKASSPPSSRRKKVFSMASVKPHFLGYYTRHIRLFGTTDSYNTQIGESEHRVVKRRYAKTNKVRPTSQIARHERKHAHLKAIRARFEAKKLKAEKRTAKRLEVEPSLEPLDPTHHHHIGVEANSSIDVGQFVRGHRGDPAVKDFLYHLKEHILCQIDRDSGASLQDCTPHAQKERDALFIQNNRLHFHCVLQVNYTTYDVRRAQDSVNPRTDHCTIVLFDPHTTPGQEHPYTYARVVKIFHVNVIDSRMGARNAYMQRRDVLWVRWFTVTRTSSARKDRRPHRLEKVAFLPKTNNEAFGFISPDDVVCGCHMIPDFTSDPSPGLGTLYLDSLIEKPNTVSRFADRDILMRYHPNFAVGHARPPFEQPTAREPSKPSSAVQPVSVEEDEPDSSDDESGLADAIQADGSESKSTTHSGDSDESDDGQSEDESDND